MWASCSLEKGLEMCIIGTGTCINWYTVLNASVFRTYYGGKIFCYTGRCLTLLHLTLPFLFIVAWYSFFFFNFHSHLYYEQAVYNYEIYFYSIIHVLDLLRQVIILVTNPVYLYPKWQYLPITVGNNPQVTNSCVLVYVYYAAGVHAPIFGSGGGGGIWVQNSKFWHWHPKMH